MVGSNGRHGLKCKQAIGRKFRHEEVNKLLKRGLDQVKLPSTLDQLAYLEEATRKDRMAEPIPPGKMENA